MSNAAQGVLVMSKPDPAAIQKLWESAPAAKILFWPGTEDKWPDGLNDLMASAEDGVCPECGGEMDEQERTEERRFFKCQNEQCHIMLIDDKAFDGLWRIQ